MCVHACVFVHLPEAGPVSRTEPASYLWEMHRWPAEAKLGKGEKNGQMERKMGEETVTKVFGISSAFPT